jgi:hypothetical protein
MSELTIDLAQKRRVGQTDAPTTSSILAVKTTPPYPEDAQKVPMLLTLVRIAAAVVLVALLITYFIVAFCVDEYRLIWTRGT